VKCIIELHNLFFASVWVLYVTIYKSDNIAQYLSSTCMMRINLKLIRQNSNFLLVHRNLLYMNGAYICGISKMKNCFPMHWLVTLHVSLFLLGIACLYFP